MFVPWPLRRVLLQVFCGYKIHPTARIGYSIVAVADLVMLQESRIGHCNVIKNLLKFELGEFSILGNGNWISGLLPESSPYFASQADRRSNLLLGAHSAVTHGHRIDCSDSVFIGEFTTVAGWGSQILTHSINLERCIQECKPTTIGSYSFIGSRSILLGGSRIPSRSVLGAGSVLLQEFNEECTLYAGVPARRIKDLDPSWEYFNRVNGPVD